MPEKKVTVESIRKRQAEDLAERTKRLNESAARNAAERAKGNA